MKITKFEKTYMVIVALFILFLMINFITLSKLNERMNNLDKKDILGLIGELEGTIVVDRESSGLEVDYNPKEVKEIKDEIKNLTKEKEELEQEEFLKALREATNSSMNVELNTEKTFEELYEKYTTIFEERYDSSIDGSHFSGEYIQTIPELIKNNYHGDCDDYAVFLYVLAKKKGYEVNYVHGDAGDMKHIWIRIRRYDKNWIEYESTRTLTCVSCISESYKEVEVLEI